VAPVAATGETLGETLAFRHFSAATEAILYKDLRLFSVQSIENISSTTLNVRAVFIGVGSFPRTKSKLIWFAQMERGKAA